MRLLWRADRAEALGDHAFQIGMRGVDLRIDHRDQDVVAPDHAVHVGNLELLQNVLRGVALWAGVAARGRGGVLLVRPKDVDRLHHGEQLDAGKRLEDVAQVAAVGDAQTHCRRAGDGDIFRGEDLQSERRNGVAQPVDADARGDLHQRLVVDQARLGDRRDVDDPAVEAGRQVLSAGRWRGLLPLLLLLGRQAGAAGTGVDDRRGVERGQLSGTDADEIIDDLHRTRQRLEEGRGRDRGRRWWQDGGVDEPAEWIAAACDARWNRRRTRNDSAGDSAVSAGAGDHTRAGRIRDGAGVGSDQGADGAVSTGAGDRTRSRRIRDGASVGSNQAAPDARRADGDIAARLRAGDGAAGRIRSD